MHLRKATLDDIDDLNRISVSSKKHWGYPDRWIEKWMDELTLTRQKLSTQYVFVLEVGSEKVGFCSIAENEDHYEILHLWLLPEYIGQGYGKKLLAHAIAQVVKTDKPIIVESDPNAEAFYERQGFVTFDKLESYPRGRFLPVMKKSAPLG